MNVCPQQFGKGYERNIALRDISLLIIDQEFNEDFGVEREADESDSEIEFGFNLSGTHCLIPGGNNFIQWSVNGLQKAGISETLAGEKLLKVDIHLEFPDLLRSFIISNFESLPLDIRQLIEGFPAKADFKQDSITPAMYLPLQQIINCPYQNLTKHIYLEAKCLELIALKIEQLSSKKKLKKSIIIKLDDIERIHYAKDILVGNLNNPPSLLELARLTGLNDYKLKIGFHQIFGTTVFGYLYQHRMEQARQLLLEGKMKVKDVALYGWLCKSESFCSSFSQAIWSKSQIFP
ncbi:MAG: AraC family transcriptional regulator [Tolypothrix carrinoi HA7290-LM1]|jgi:AraC-like DNA-binding protein|nr:AraC family transcriptional regulator [Tolypothrix carrinoi HA7290-LM1]